MDCWHALILNHVRAMVGYDEEEYLVLLDRCLYLWTQQVGSGSAYRRETRQSTRAHVQIAVIMDH